MAAKSPSAESVTAVQAVAGELVVVRAAGEAPLPRRQGGRATDRVAQLTALLSRDKEAVNQHNLLIISHRSLESVHEILALGISGFSITSK